MYVMGRIFDRNDMKRFNSSYHNLDIDSFSSMVLCANWNQKGFKERLGAFNLFVCPYTLLLMTDICPVKFTPD
jgi:hypothetical protein